MPLHESQYSGAGSAAPPFGDSAAGQGNFLQYPALASHYHLPHIVSERKERKSG